MYSTFGNFLRWSEVWALFFPLYQLLKTPNNSRSLRPVSYYVILAFILNLAANLISNQKSIGLFLPWHNNVIIYNIHSIVRFVCFSVFFTNLSSSIPDCKSSSGALFIRMLFDLEKYKGSK